MFERAQRGVLGEAAKPAVRGQRLRGNDRIFDRFAARIVVTGDIRQPGRKPAPASAAVLFGADNPAPQLDRFLPGQRSGKGTVGGVEHVVSFVEHDPRRAAGRIAAACGVDHHQRVIGDHQIGLRRIAGAAFDEAFAVMGAAGIDAFAALVGQRGNPALAEQRAQPTGQVAADHVAILRIGGPARDQMRKDCGATREPALQGVFQIEQAEVVLAPLAHHHGRRTIGACGRPRAAAFAAQLALQVLGIGRYPHGPARPFGPERGGGEVAERLADAGAGLRQQNMRPLLPVARPEDMPCIAREQPLAFTPFGAFAGQPLELGLDFGFVDEHLRRLRPFGGFLPFGEPREQPLLGPLGPADMRREHARPGPSQPRKRLQRRPRAFAFGPVVAFAGRDQSARGALQQ